jgi:hypothetical protein
VSEQCKSRTTVYNLSVDEDHTYFADGVLVHNCAGCLAEDGTEYDNDVDFEAHPNCRCSLIAVCEGVDPPEWTAGGDWFEEQDEETQRNILGPGRYELWQNGQVSDFRRFATHTQNETWGGAVVPTLLSALGG